MLVNGLYFWLGSVRKCEPYKKHACNSLVVIGSRQQLTPLGIGFRSQALIFQGQFEIWKQVTTGLECAVLTVGLVRRSSAFVFLATFPAGK